MKKYLPISAILLALFTFVGCDGYRDGYYDGENKLFIIDQDNRAVSDIRYSCDNGRKYEYTNRDGAFYFYDNEDCALELELKFVDSRIDDLFIEDNYGDGVDGIRYFCDNGDEGRTDRNGHFYFNNRERDDVCTLIL